MLGSALFKRNVQRYGRTPEPETPFQRAGQLWDDRLGSARVQAKNWRLMAFGSLAMSTGLATGLVWQSAQGRVTPYVVEVDRLGEARAVREADTGYRPTDPQIAWHIAHFITNIRSVSLDPVITRRAWLEAYDYTTRRGGQFLDDYARANDPFARMGERTVSIQVTSIVRASDRSFQAKWIETIYERGVQASRSHWTAILSVVVKPPSSAEVLRKNPLGLYVDAIDWSREIEPAPAPPTPALATVPDELANSADFPAGAAPAPQTVRPPVSSAPEKRP